MGTSSSIGCLRKTANGFDMSKQSDSPQPVDPYQSANAQLGLNTGTANYNAALNRTSSVNPLGSSGWNITGTGPGGAPLYQQSTQLAPQFQSEIQPINTSNIPGLGANGNPNQETALTQEALYNQQMGYLQPQQALQTEQEKSQLAAEGATPGSAAYSNDMGTLGRQQTFANQQATDSAITGGEAETQNLYNLGGQSLSEEQASQMFPIQEYNALNGGAAAQSGAASPNIMDAFNQQYQGELNSANASNASSNATTGAATSLLGSYLMYMALA